MQYQRRETNKLLLLGILYRKKSSDVHLRANVPLSKVESMQRKDRIGVLMPI